MITLTARTGGFEIEHCLHLNRPSDVDFAAHWAVVNHAPLGEPGRSSS
jgi:hypothetical protein